MDAKNLEPGMHAEYYPPPQIAGDNRHFPCVVVKVGRLVTCKVFMDLHPEGIVRNVSAKRIVNNQLPLIY